MIGANKDGALKLFKARFRKGKPMTSVGDHHTLWLVMFLVCFTWVAGCPSTSENDDGGSRAPDRDSGSGGMPNDGGLAQAGNTDAGTSALKIAAIELAEGVQATNLETYMEDLVAMGTRYTFSQGDETARAYLKSTLEGWGYTVLEQSFDVQGETAVNLIAKKEGLTAPEKIVVFSAHYDSTSELPLALAPGADDNASGVAALLESARIMRDATSGKSIWFVLTAAEEQGSLGSAALAEEWANESRQIEAVIAPDMIGYWPLGHDDAMDILGDSQSEQLAEDMASMAEALEVPYQVWIRHDYCYGDDHTNYQENGFPAVSPMDCVEAHNVFASGETTPHYHVSTDNMDTIHLGFTTRVVKVLVATFAYWSEPALE